MKTHKAIQGVDVEKLQGMNRMTSIMRKMSLKGDHNVEDVIMSKDKNPYLARKVRSRGIS